MPLGYLGTAAAEGAALYAVLLAAAKAERADVSFAGVVLLAAGASALVTGVLYGVAGGAFVSDCGVLYVIGVLVCGGAVPAVAGFMVWKKPESALVWAVVALVGAVAGAIVYRCAMWLLGESLYGFFNLM